MTVRIYVRHDVTDYAAWRKVYKAFDAQRQKMGVVAQAVYRSIDDANDVTVTHDFASAEKAKAFASSPDLRAVMEKAGVKGTPQIWFTTRMPR
jgi:quinol monooxygenase YgiN